MQVGAWTRARPPRARADVRFALGRLGTVGWWGRDRGPLSTRYAVAGEVDRGCAWKSLSFSQTGRFGRPILDPTCGSGAFPFATLNILEPLYEACLDRMESFVEDIDRAKAAGERVDPSKHGG